MDSIQLLETTLRHYGETCHVTVSNGDTYTGVYHGYSESTPENPLVLRLGIGSAEAERIGVPYMSEIGISYDVIKSIEF